MFSYLLLLLFCFSIVSSVDVARQAAKHNVVVKPKQRPFSLEQALIVNELCYTLSCSSESVIHWSCVWCKLVPDATPIGIAVDDFYQGETRAMVAVANSTIYVIYQGSHNLANWIRDFDFPKIDYPPHQAAQVHQGFYYSYFYMRDRMRKLVNVALDSKHCANDRCDTIIVCGHSFGAALSVFQALDFTQNPAKTKNSKPITNVQIWNMGQPRVGDKTFVNWVESNGGLTAYYRCTHIEDPVPHLPMEILGFEHGPREIYNDVWNGTSYKICDGSGEDPTCSDSNILLDPTAHLIYFGQSAHFGPITCPHSRWKRVPLQIFV